MTEVRITKTRNRNDPHIEKWETTQGQIMICSGIYDPPYIPTESAMSLYLWDGQKWVHYLSSFFPSYNWSSGFASNYILLYPQGWTGRMKVVWTDEKSGQLLGEREAEIVPAVIGALQIGSVRVTQISPTQMNVNPAGTGAGSFEIRLNGVYKTGLSVNWGQGGESNIVLNVPAESREYQVCVEVV